MVISDIHIGDDDHLCSSDIRPVWTLLGKMDNFDTR